MTAPANTGGTSAVSKCEAKPESCTSRESGAALQSSSVTSSSAAPVSNKLEPSPSSLPQRSSTSPSSSSSVNGNPLPGTGGRCRAWPAAWAASVPRLR